MKSPKLTGKDELKLKEMAKKVYGKVVNAQCAGKEKVYEIIKEAISSAHGDGRSEERERCAKYHEQRIEHFQACINKAKSDMEKDGQQYHQQHIWEFQAMRDEHIQSASEIRALKGKP